MDAGEAAAKRKTQGERLSRVMWAYVCGAITLMATLAGLGATFIPLGFGVLGGILAWQLSRTADRRHAMVAGMLTLGGLMIWVTLNWPTIHRFVGG